MKIQRGWLETSARMALGDIAVVDTGNGLELRSFSVDMNSQRCDWSEEHFPGECRAPIVDKRKLAAAVTLCTGSEIEVKVTLDTNGGVVKLIGATGQATLPSRAMDSIPIAQPEGMRWDPVPKMLVRKIPDGAALGGESTLAKPTVAMHPGGIISYGAHAAWWREGEGIGLFRFAIPPDPGRWAGDDVEMSIDEASAMLWARGNGFIERYRGLETNLTGQLRYFAGVREKSADEKNPRLEVNRGVLVERLRELVDIGSWPPSAMPAVGLKFNADKKKARLYTWRSPLAGECDIPVTGGHGKVDLVVLNPKLALEVIAGADPKGLRDVCAITVVTVGPDGSEAKGVILEVEGGEGGLIAGMSYGEEHRTLEVAKEAKQPRRGRKGANKGESDGAAEESEAAA